jgi:hypothetical protein
MEDVGQNEEIPQRGGKFGKEDKSGQRRTFFRATPATGEGPVGLIGEWLSSSQSRRPTPAAGRAEMALLSVFACFTDAGTRRRAGSVQIRFIAMLKPPFKF